MAKSRKIKPMSLEEIQQRDAVLGWSQILGGAMVLLVPILRNFLRDIRVHYKGTTPYGGL